MSVVLAPKEIRKFCSDPMDPETIKFNREERRATKQKKEDYLESQRIRREFNNKRRKYPKCNCGLSIKSENHVCKKGGRK